MYSIQYHIVRCVKYRRKVLIDDIEKTLNKISNKNNRNGNRFRPYSYIT